MTHKRLTWLGAGTGLLVLAADQASKWWVLDVLHLPELRQVVVLPVLNLTFVRNPGVTFGLLNGLGDPGSNWGHLLLAAIALGVVAALAVWLRRAESAIVAISIGAIAGGAIGNVIDRMRFGWVVDFIHAHVGGWSWYVFNVADAAIVCGVVALVLDGLRPRRHTGEDHLAGASNRR
jgi:lipoprotein signal peptidase